MNNLVILERSRRLTAFKESPAALPEALYDALRRVDDQLDDLIHQAVPFNKAA